MPGDTRGFKTPGFTLDQFCKLKGQLKQEFVALVDSKSFIDGPDGLETDIALASGQEKNVLQTTFNTIDDAVDKPDGDIASPILSLVEALAELADEAELVLAPEVAIASELAAESIDLAIAVSNDSGKPIGQTLSEDAADLGGRSRVTSRTPPRVWTASAPPRWGTGDACRPSRKRAAMRKRGRRVRSPIRS